MPRSQDIRQQLRKTNGVSEQTGGLERDLRSLIRKIVITKYAISTARKGKDASERKASASCRGKKVSLSTLLKGDSRKPNTSQEGGKNHTKPNRGHGGVT